MVAEAVALLGPGPWNREAIARAGWTRRQVDRSIEAGRLVRVRRGALAPSDTERPTDTVAADGTASAADAPPWAGDHPARMLELRAVLDAVSPSAVVSHASAADLHGLWTPGRGSTLIHLTVPGQSERTSGGVRVHGSRLRPQHVEIVHGVRVTSMARTAIDLARGRALADALVPLDSALRLLAHGSDQRRRPLLASVRDPEAVAWARDGLERALADVWSWPGTRVVRRGLDMASALSESAFESWSRGWMELDGLPRPCLAHHVLGASGASFVSDFAWLEQRVLGEADGLGKYGASPQEFRDRLLAERRRQHDLEAAGWRVVRWTTGERPRSFLNRLARTLAAPGPLE